jgi:non-specific serine/threonine protein kinase
LSALETELPNVRSALTWLRDAGDVGCGLRLATALWTFWVVHDHVPEGRRWLDELLTRAPDDEGTRLRALVVLGDLAERQGDYAGAVSRTEEALALARRAGDHGTEAAALRGLGNLAIAQGEVALHGLGDADLADAEFARAETFLRQGLDLARGLADEWGAAKTAQGLAITVGFRGDASGAIAYLDDAIAAFRRLGDQRQLSVVLWNLGGSLLNAGELARARSSYIESMALARRLGYRWHESLCLDGLALVASASGEHARTARLLGEAEVLREATGAPLRPLVQSHHDQIVVATRAALGEADFAAAWAAGAGADLDELFAEVPAGAPAEPDAPAEPPAPVALHGLTARELDVVRLLAEGLSDKEIATTLFVSRRTAANHVAAILRKLGAPSRAGAVAYAVRQGWA